MSFFRALLFLLRKHFVVVVICWLFWCSNKKLAYCLGFTYFTSGLLVQGLKITFRVPRPWLLDSAFEPVASAVPGATGYSFPSGHTQSITALLGTLGLYTRKKPARFLCALFYSACRLFPYVSGLSYSSGCNCIFPGNFPVRGRSAISFLYKKDFSAGKELLISLCMAAVCAALLIYTAVLYKNGTIEFHYAQDCIKACGAGFAFAVGYYITETHISFTPPDSTRKRIIRFVVGIAVTLLIQTGLKPLIGESLPASFLRYFIVVIWIVTVYPFLFSRKK